MTTKQLELIRLLFCDASGGRRCRVVPKSAAMTEEGFGLTKAIMGLPMFEDVVVKDDRVDAMGEIRTVGDPISLVNIP